jgi:RNA polymerase sigma-70 factor (ECF subfamily)
MQLVEPASDMELVERSQSGDRDAFGELVRRYYQRCLSVALSFLRNRDDAEDEIQDAFRKALEHICDLEARECFASWLTQIVANECYMRLRQRKLHPTAEFEEHKQGALPARVFRSGTRNPESQVAYREILDLVKVETSRVPVFLRAAFILSDIDQKSLPEVARTLGISVAAAKSRIHRARYEVRERMKKHGIVRMPYATC